QLASRGDDALRGQLEEMESGGIFRQYGLVNLLEGDFFLWNLHAWNDDIACALRDLLNRLDDYDPTTLTIPPEETRDLFKKLYHDLLPREVRHNLGEYYTPDWLAQRLLTQVDNDFFTTDPARGAAQPTLRRKLRELRWLDPACGSGTFPILIIQRYLEIGRELMVNEADLLEWITTNIVGFDLNPLAVMTARVNYLLAIADLLEHRRGEVTIPIYLADSIATPSLPERQLDMETGGGYRLTTAVGRFLIPREAFEHNFDGFCELLDRSVRAELSAQAFCQQATQELGLQLDTLGQTILGELCEQLGDLHRQGLNGLWARLIKNNFAPLTVGRFDYVVGNPPWINWEHLPDGYREDTRDLWTRYGLAHGGRLAIAKVDISALMTYIAMDAYLKPSGRLGFVITQAVFKTNWAGRGFRRFTIPQSKGPDIPLRVVHVDDMVELQPFEGASNRTTVAILDRDVPTRYPVSYTLWRKTRGLPRGQGLTYDHTLEEVFKITQRHNLFAEPVSADDPTSSWLTAPKPALQGLRKVRGSSPLNAHEGVNSGGANAVYFVERLMERPDGLVVISNITEGTKVEVPQVREVVEPDLLYPLLRGRDVRRWNAEPSSHIVVVSREDGTILGEEEMQREYPRTYAYLGRFRDRLSARTHPITRGALQRGAPFFWFMGLACYTFAPWKVVWKEMADSLTCAVVGCSDGKPVVPDHKIMLIDFERQEEAFYAAAALNSASARLLCRGYAIGVQMDPHIAENIAVPAFDGSDLHVRLAELSRAAHEAAAAGDNERVAEIEAEIDELAAELWGLTQKELQDIRDALKIIS
ncbi:MAG: SAM-dependent DNA methyltransferase, partial [Armatimonadota bacterium]